MAAPIVDVNTNVRGVWIADPASGNPLGTSANPLVVSGGSAAAADEVQGNIANGAADGTTKPVKIGVRYNLTIGTLTDGQRGDAQGDDKGNLRAILAGPLQTGADGLANAGSVGMMTSRGSHTTYGFLATGGYYYNGTSWDRVRGDTAASFAKSPPLAGTDRSITATTTSQQLMAANATRSKFFIKNDTAIVVWVNLGATAVATAGSGNVAVAANGGYWEMTGTSGAVNIIAASGTPAITAREF